MQIYKKSLIDIFTTILGSDYKAYCERHKLTEDNTSFLDYLFTKELLSETGIRRYTISREFEKLSQLGGSNKTQVVRLLADRFGLTERTVWNMVKYDSARSKR